MMIFTTTFYFMYNTSLNILLPIIIIIIHTLFLFSARESFVIFLIFFGGFP